MDAAQESVSAATLWKVIDSNLISLSLSFARSLSLSLSLSLSAPAAAAEQSLCCPTRTTARQINYIIMTSQQQNYKIFNNYITSVAPPNPGPAAPQGTTNTSPLPNPWAPPGSSSSVPRTTGTSSSTTTNSTSQSQRGGAGQRGQSGSTQQQTQGGQAPQGMFGVSIIVHDLELLILLADSWYNIIP